MTARINPKQSTRNAQAASQAAASPASVPYSPSVPISLYRQVATELQTAQGSLEALKSENKRLFEQNQQLRLEIERVVQSALQLRQIADTQQSLHLPGEMNPPQPNLEVRFEAPPSSKTPAKPRRNAPKSEDPDAIASSPEQLFVEVESQPRRSSTAEKAPEVGGWWLVLVVFLIVVTAFGTGFLIVRPLLPNR